MVEPKFGLALEWREVAGVGGVVGVEVLLLFVFYRLDALFLCVSLPEPLCTGSYARANL